MKPVTGIGFTPGLMKRSKVVSIVAERAQGKDFENASVTSNNFRK